MTKKSQVIPIVFATDDNYAAYLGVAIKSLIEHASPQRKYEIRIIYNQLSDYNRERLSALATDNVEIILNDISAHIPANLFYSKSFWSEASFYRLLIPEILPQYDKILYLDCDLAILTDVAEIYDTDIGQNYLGAIASFPETEQRSAEELSYLADVLHLTDINEYFNSGVLLMNLKEIRKDEVMKKGFKLIRTGQSFQYVDQDVLNSIMHKRVKFLPPAYNFKWHYEFLRKPEIAAWYREKCGSPLIIHYTSAYKPWNSPQYKYANLFWKYARMTDFYEEIIYRNCKIIDFAPIRDALKLNALRWKYYLAKFTMPLASGKLKKYLKEQKQKFKYHIRNAKSFLGK